MSPNGSSDTEPFFSEDHAGEETGGDVCVEEKKKKKMVKCRLCGENVPDDVELQQLHEKWYHYQEVIEIEEEPHESVHLPKSGRKIRKRSCSCCE